MAWTPETSCGFESRKIKYLIPRYTRGRGLEIGCGMEKAYPHFIGVDNGHHFGRGAADIVADACDLSMFADGSMDFVFSSHVLEHMEDMGKALAEWGRVIKPGGYLVLYVPSANLYPKCGEPGANPDHKHDIYPGDIARLITSNVMRDNFDWTQIECEERGEGNEYSIFEVWRKNAIEDAIIGRSYVVMDKDSQPQKKTACVCRFGGFGDMLQASLVFPRLKEQGYHVTVMTTPKGRDIIRHDPHVDDWYILDQDQVPNNELVAFWREQARRFNRFVNLSESIEGTLLALPGRTNHAWPLEVRKKRMNTNYHEWTAELAGVPFKPCRLFYASENELENARTRTGIGDYNQCATFNIMWALSGSSMHKAMPHMDAVIARIMIEMPEARVFLVGDDACRVLEQGWQREERVVCLSGQMSIRDTLALAQQCRCVVGPETGVLNAVGMDDQVHKVIYLSHSSANNLTKHWTNTQALTPEDCPCHPCHLLHYGSEFCTEKTLPLSALDEATIRECRELSPDALREDRFHTGAALCAYNISPAAIYEAVAKVYRNWRRK